MGDERVKVGLLGLKRRRVKCAKKRTGKCLG